MKRARSNLGELADRMSDALGFVECALIALQDDESAWPAMLVLQHGLTTLREVHRSLDSAHVPLPKRRPRRLLPD